MIHEGNLFQPHFTSKLLGAQIFNVGFSINGQSKEAVEPLKRCLGIGSLNNHGRKLQHQRSIHTPRYNRRRNERANRHFSIDDLNRAPRDKTDIGNLLNCSTGGLGNGRKPPHVEVVYFYQSHEPVPPCQHRPSRSVSLNSLGRVENLDHQAVLAGRAYLHSVGLPAYEPRKHKGKGDGNREGEQYH